MARRTKNEQKYKERNVDKNVSLRLYPSGKGRAIAYGSINIMDKFCIRVRVFERDNGDCFISFPSYKNGDEYVNTAFCFDNDMISDLNELARELCDDF